MDWKTLTSLGRFKDIVMVLLRYGFNDLVDRLNIPGNKFMRKKSPIDYCKKSKIINVRTGVIHDRWLVYIIGGILLNDNAYPCWVSFLNQAYIGALTNGFDLHPVRTYTAREVIILIDVYGYRTAWN